VRIRLRRMVVIIEDKNISIRKTLKLRLSTLMCLSFAIPAEVSATALRIQSVGTKLWKVNAPLDLTKVIFHVDNIHSKHTLDLTIFAFYNKFDVFVDELQKTTGKEKLGISCFFNSTHDIKNISGIACAFQSPAEYQSVFYSFIQANLLDAATPKLKDDELVTGYKSAIQKQIQSFSETTLWDQISKVVYKAGDPKLLTPMVQSKLKQLDM